MRKLKIIEHISLDGVIQHSADDGGFPYSDWTAPYRTPAGRLRADLVPSWSRTSPERACDVVELSGLQRPGDPVGAEDDAGRHCLRAGELE